MLNKQRGATLLEAILAAAIMGWMMAYAGTQLLKYAEKKSVEELAMKIFDNMKIYQEYITTEVFELSVPDADGATTEINPFFSMTISNGFISDEWGLYDRYFVLSPLDKLKIESCAEGGELNNNIKNVFFECGQYDVDGEIKHRGIYVMSNMYSSIAVPEIKARPFVVQSYYTIKPTGDFDLLLQVAMAISDIREMNGFYISGKNITLSVFNFPDSTRSAPASASAPRTAARSVEAEQVYDENLTLSIDKVKDGDITALNEFKTAALATNKDIGFFITLNVTESFVYLKRDGSVTMQTDKSLCWSDIASANMPCIGSFINTDDTATNSINIEGGLVYGKGVKKTPVTVNYHTFTGGAPLNIAYLNCPTSTAVGGLQMTNKLAVVPSSFSTGSENSSNFTDPANIVSSGTKGAGGKHSFTSGFSLEWEANNATKMWQIRGAVAIDSAYDDAHNNSSVIRNPNSISFVTLQWCEG